MLDLTSRVNMISLRIFILSSEWKNTCVHKNSTVNILPEYLQIYQERTLHTAQNNTGKTSNRP
jgi:hypothetical protein